MSADNLAMDNVFADWVLAAFHVNTDIYHPWKTAVKARTKRHNPRWTSRGREPSKPGRKDTVPGELAVDESRQSQDEKTQSQVN